MTDWEEFLLNLDAYLVIGGAGILLAAIALLSARYFFRRPLPLARLRPGRWTGREVQFALIAHALFVPFVVLALLASFSTNFAPDQNNKEAVRRAAGHLIILGSPLNVFLTLAIVVTMLYALSRTRPHQVGITWARWPANVILGVLLYLLITVPILSVHFLVTQMPGSEKHLFERLVDEGLEWWEWVLLVFMTVCGAPLVEEFIYRGVLQGWLRRASLIGHAVVLVVVLAIGVIPLTSLLVSEQDVDNVPLIAAVAPSVFGWVLAGGYSVGLYLLWRRCQQQCAGQWPWPVPTLVFPRERSRIMPDDEARERTGDEEAFAPSIILDSAEADRRRLAWPAAYLSIYGSSMVWSMMHYDAWPAPIPLFLLGLGLGWLALRTQSLIGPMVCHALFNAVACLALYWGT